LGASAGRAQHDVASKKLYSRMALNVFRLKGQNSPVIRRVPLTVDATTSVESETGGRETASKRPGFTA
jgi:hypothetical protein